MQIQQETLPQYKSCTHTSHSGAAKSPYPKDKTPIIYFLEKPNNPNSKILKTCIHCRQYVSMKSKERKDLRHKQQAEMSNDEFRLCIGIHHVEYSLHPKDRVPIALFRKKAEDVNSKLFDLCVDCRDKQRENRQDNKNRIKEVIELSRKDLSSGFIVCSSPSHVSSGSIYPKDRVPIEMFVKENKKSDNDIHKKCLDCRKAAIERNNGLKNRPLKENEFSCNSCCGIYDKSYSHEKGGVKETCIRCYKRQAKYKRETRNEYRQIKFEKAEKIQSCCERCKCITLKSLDEYDTSIKVPTFEEDGYRYFIHDNMKTRVLDVLKYAKNIIEITPLDLDHLTEKEQRERGILKDWEPFIPKKCEVSCLSSIEEMRIEAKKTQLLCCRCHVIVTAERIREKTNERRKSKGKEELKDNKPNSSKKAKFVAKYKAPGCEFCKYEEPELPGYFHLDHIDPSTKIDSVSRMVRDKKYKFEDIIDECKKCRILCYGCHRIRTMIQFGSEHYKYDQLIVEINNLVLEG